LVAHKITREAFFWKYQCHWGINGRQVAIVGLEGSVELGNSD
jgi:hypothetical protein